MGDTSTKTRPLATEDIQDIWRRNQTVPGGVERCVHDLFGKQAEARPDALAVYAWDGEMTYGELDALSTKLARHLVELGVKAEDIVPLCFEKSMWTVVAMLAVLKAGGAFVPLDPAHPRSRHEEILKQTKAGLVLTSTYHQARWHCSSLTVVTASEASVVPLNYEVNIGFTAATPRNMAYVMFTSGSTGTPKGVVLEHQALATSCLEHGRVFGLSPHTKALQYASYTFDVCLTEIVSTLLYGGCVCVPLEEDRCNNLAMAINTLHVNWVLLTPTVAQVLEPSEIPFVERIILGGEQVNCSDCKRWDGHVEVVNGYGPTECSIWCVTYSGLKGFKSGLIGKSIASVSWVVDVNNHEQLAPVGSVGELLVEGPILARGYLNDAEKTRAAFIDDPAWLVEGGGGFPGRRDRLYKTGDLVHYDSDGNLVYMGRKDDQVKVRGQRVELGEVEHHLRECMPEVKRVAVEVILPAGERGNAVLAAFLQLDSEESNPVQTDEAANAGSMARVTFPADADGKLAERLPGYMVPVVYFAVAQLPMTVSGKTDRKRLREIGGSFSAQQLAELRTSSEGVKRAPSTEAERTMQRLWAGVLCISADSIGLDDSFFRLGGDSIAAMKLVGEARRRGMRLNVAHVFRQPTLTHMCLTLLISSDHSMQSIPPFSLLAPNFKESILCESGLLRGSVRQEDVADVLPTTHVQRLFINLGVESPREAFNYFLLDIGLEIDVPLLRDSCQRLLNHFPILRTQFAPFQGELWQVVLLRPSLPFKTFDVSGSLAEETHAICMEDIYKTDPLELPTSFILVRNKSIGHRLIVRLSHAQYDGVCLPVILESLAALYKQEALAPTLYFSAYLAHVRNQRIEITQYWRQLFKGSRMTKVTAHLRPKVGEQPALHNIKVERLICAPQLPENITMASLLSSAWALVLHSITGEEDVVYGHTVAGRNSDIPGIAEMVGPRVNIVPVRARMHLTRTSAELIRSVHEQYISLGQADSAQLDEIVQDCTDWPAGSEFDSMVQHQNINEHPEICFSRNTAKLQWFEKPFGVVQQLYFLSHPQADQLKLTVGGNTRILTVEAAHSVLDVLAATIAELSRNLKEPLASCKFPFPLCISN
jgi:amino acid adenylation domain-containing protein